MLSSIVRVSLASPRLIVVSALLILLYGSYLLTKTEFEVFPEFVPAQASVQTEAPGLSTGQVELMVTRPIEEVINGATGIASVRSRSIQGLSVVDVTFREGEDPYQARQVVAERLGEVSGRLPLGVGAPTISPLTSSTMDLLKIGLLSERLTPMELRDIAQWTIRPRLLATAGVARVNLFGGELRRIEVRIRETDLQARNLVLADVIGAIQAATAVRGGGFVDTDTQRILIESGRTASTSSDIAESVVAPAPAGPILLRDVADIIDSPAPMFGDTLVMGKPGVLLTLASQYGANTFTTTRAVELALEDLRGSLEAQGITLYPGLHRPANFIETALAGIRDDLILGTLLILVVLLGFMRSLRVAFIAFVSIPLSLIAAVIALELTGQTINNMILGGLAVALGVVIDDAVIGTENILRRLRLSAGQSRWQVVLNASIEVRSPIIYATLVVALTMLPILLLTGLQGAFFSPLALSFLLATFASLLVAITVTPALALLLLDPARLPREQTLITGVKALHQKLLRYLCHKPRFSMAATAFIGLSALIGFNLFGSELLPSFRERHYVLAVNGPSGASLSWMRDIGARISSDLLAIEGVATVEQQIGRAEAGEDTFPPSESEFHVELGTVSGEEEQRVLEEIRSVLGSYPGIESEALTFLGDRIGESLSGETAAIVISAYGADLDILDSVAAQLAAVVRSVPGAVDVKIKTPPGAPSFEIIPDANAMAIHGVNALDVYDAIETAYQGKRVAQIADGQRLIDIAVTTRAGHPMDPERANQIVVRNTAGNTTSLRNLASFRQSNSRATISRDGGRRHQVVTANSQDPDVAGLTARIQQAVGDRLVLPAGVYLEYTGVAQGQIAAERELLLNVAVAAVGMVGLLILAFGGGRPAALILLSAPPAMAGGVAAVTLAGGVVSLGALVGFVTLFGIAARNAILLIAHTDHLVEKEGQTWGLETVLRATSERLLPILMTALVTGLGMVPLAMGSGEAGREIQGPMAQVILGGLVTSTVLNLLLLPPLLLAYRHRHSG